MSTDSNGDGRAHRHPRRPELLPFPMWLLAVAVALLDQGSAAAAVATQISVGSATSCAIDDAGGLSCWGANDRGQLGDGTTIDRSTPVGVSSLGSGVARVSAGERLTCAVTAAGGAKCWGANEKGQIGDGSTTDRPVPVDVSGLTSGVAAIAAGASSACALTTGGGVKCWGYNVRGTLGDGTFTDSTTPVDVVGLASGVTAIAHGGSNACALLANGSVKCWGANFSGELGNGATADSNVPVDVTGLASGAVAISSDAGVSPYSCAVLATGGVKCWGSSVTGISSTATSISALASGVDAISVGRSSAVVLSGGAVELLYFPGTVLPVQGLTSGTVAVGGSPSFDHVCVLSTAGEVRCFGFTGPELGGGPTPSSPGSAGCVAGFGDDDFDRICEAIDPCAGGVAGGVGTPPPRLVLTSLGPTSPSGDERVTFRTRFPLPAGVAFGDLDPPNDGARLVLLDPASVLLDRVYSGGVFGGRGTAGWLQAGSGKRWTFTDATGANGKVVGRLTLTDKGGGLPGGLVELNVVRGPDTVTIDRNHIALQAVFVPGNAAAADAGLCAQTNLVGFCRFNGRHTTLTCKP